jgi:hypothetical protein
VRRMAAESLAFTIPVYVLLFATIYHLMDHANPASFGTQLTRTDTLYFSVHRVHHCGLR